MRFPTNFPNMGEDQLRQQYQLAMKRIAQLESSLNNLTTVSGVDPEGSKRALRQMLAQQKSYRKEREKLYEKIDGALDDCENLDMTSVVGEALACLRTAEANLDRTVESYAEKAGEAASSVNSKAKQALSRSTSKRKKS